MSEVPLYQTVAREGICTISGLRLVAEVSAPKFLNPAFKPETLQSYLAHKKQRPPRTLQ